MVIILVIVVVSIDPRPGRLQLVSWQPCDNESGAKNRCTGCVAYIKHLLSGKTPEALSMSLTRRESLNKRVKSIFVKLQEHISLKITAMEHIRTPKVENVRLVDRFNARKPTTGTLYLTTTHLIFVDPAGKKETWILHMHIGTVEKMSLTTTGSPLHIRCKNFMQTTFIIPRERDCHDIYTSLLKLSQPAELGELYAFHYTAQECQDRLSGWDFFDMQSEYLRMGVPNTNWVLTPINKEYEMCDTYPRYLYVPSTATTPVLLGSARFRSRSRLPALSYLHRGSNAAIVRCSQPLAGFSARCVEDEQMLQAIRKANPSSSYMFVVDTRPKINAMANRAAGKGYENENFYSNIKFQFWGIENIHVMRNSLQKVLEICDLRNPSMSAFLSGLENSGWLKHVKAVLDTSAFIARAIAEGISVVVHCSDGWDRTAQTCSLASLMLDPYYRTIDGFQTLIEKEWLSFGHKFTDRCGLLGTVDAKEVSPVFTQFVDAVWQCMQQFPRIFEFNERYLLTLHDHVFSCQFGTFIGNCEKDRIDLRLRERTYSLWGFFGRSRPDFLNPFYERESQCTDPLMFPETSPQSIIFWRNLFCRYDSGLHPRENIREIICALRDHTTSMDDHAALLERRISSLCQLLGKGEDQITRALSTLSLSTSESMDFRALLLNDTNNIPTDGFKHSCIITNCTTKEDIDLDSLVIEQLLLELQSVATDWKAFRNVKTCSCAMPLEHFVKKSHCWRCGSVFCARCIDRMMALPGHLSQRPVPVCKACYKDIKHSPSPSVDDFKILQRTLPSPSK